MAIYLEKNVNRDRWSTFFFSCVCIFVSNKSFFIVPLVVVSSMGLCARRALYIWEGSRMRFVEKSLNRFIENAYILVTHMRHSWDWELKLCVDTV